MAEVDVVSRIVISCVVAHALHAWLLVSPSVTTRSLITNPVNNMRCACKASENPPRSLIRDRSSIVDTRVCRRTSSDECTQKLKTAFSFCKTAKPHYIELFTNVAPRAH